METAKPGLKITHVVETLERGGLERVVVDLCVGLRQSGHDVDIVCLFQDGLLADEARALGVQVRALRKRNTLDLRTLLGLRTFLVEGPSRVIHSHNAMAGYYVGAATIGGPRAVRVNTRHGMGEAALLTRKERLYRLSLARYHTVALVCDAARSAFVSSGLVPESKAVVVPNGIPVRKFSSRSTRDRAASRAALGYGPMDFVIGTVGRLNWAKDHELLLASFERARQQVGDSARLIIVGEGDLRRPLEVSVRSRALHDVVSLPGDRSDIAELLPALDIFVCSSRTEGYSIALLEAAAAGLPVVATDVGGNGEIVRNGSTGLTVPYGDAEALSAAMVRLFKNPSYRQALGRAAQEWAMKEASVESMVERYVALYRRG